MEEVTIPKKEYNYLKKCERIITEIKEDETLNEKEIKLIEKARKEKSMSKKEFFKKIKKISKKERDYIKEIKGVTAAWREAQSETLRGILK